MFGALDGLHAFRLAFRTLKLENDLLSSLCLFLENWLRLPAKASLLLVVTSLSLRTQ